MSCLVGDKADAYLAKRAIGHSKVKEHIEERASTNPFIEGLLGDVWQGLYKMQPKLKGEDACLGGDRINRSIMGDALNSEDFNALRSYTVLDEACANVGMMEFAQTFSLPASVEEQLQDVADAQAYLEGLGEREEGDAEYSSAMDELSDAQSRAADAIDGQAVEVAGAIQRSAKKATALAKAVQQAQMFGAGSQAGAGEHQSLDVMTLVDQLNQTQGLAEILELAGRLRNIALSRLKTRTVQGCDDVVSIEYGDEIERLLPQELLALKHPALKLDGKRRLLERQMLQLEVINQEAEGRGPIVVCKDESMSMSGGRHIWATAVALALGLAAKEEGREFAIIHFGSATELTIDRFRVGEEWNLVTAAAHFFSGGTNFDKPLQAAVNVIRAEPSYEKADVVFITDGNAHVGCADSFNQAKKDINFKMIAIGVGGADLTHLEDVSDAELNLGTDQAGAVQLINRVL